MWKSRVPRYLLLYFITALLVTGCSGNKQAIPAVKVDDPFASDNEREFLGMVTTYFDLPEGESTLIRFPNGKKILIDTGSQQDSEKLLQLLHERRVTKLDYVLITNDLPEHVGGFSALANDIQVETVLLPELTAYTIQQIIKIHDDIELKLLAEGDQLSFDQDIAMRVFHPSEILFLSPQDNSLVCQIRQENLGFLFTSGISERAEERILERHSDKLASEILKVANQGTNQASSQPFLQAVDPQIAIIQTAKSLAEMKNSQSEVVERLHESWAETYITSQDGTVTVLSNGKDYKVIKGKTS